MSTKGEWNSILKNVLHCFSKRTIQNIWIEDISVGKKEEKLSHFWSTVGFLLPSVTPGRRQVSLKPWSAAMIHRKWYFPTEQVEVRLYHVVCSSLLLIQALFSFFFLLKRKSIWWNSQFWLGNRNYDFCNSKITILTSFTKKRTISFEISLSSATSPFITFEEKSFVPTLFHLRFWFTSTHCPKTNKRLSFSM